MHHERLQQQLLYWRVASKGYMQGALRPEARVGQCIKINKLHYLCLLGVGVRLVPLVVAKVCIALHLLHMLGLAKEVYLLVILATTASNTWVFRV